MAGHESGNSSTTKVEEWNGSSWTETSDCSEGTNGASGTGTGLAALKIGGSPGTNCEEWTATATVETVSFD